MVGRRKGSSSLTPLELRIMQVLWRDGPSNVQAVQQALTPDDLAYTTVQTMLNVLHRKGRVRRRMQGRAFEYSAVVSREAILRQAVRDLVDRMFGGSPEELVMNLIKTRQLDAERIAELTRALVRPEKGTPHE
ncbi:MAG: BlaI/MecI/CopY family transcriptional regulator [Acidobacteriaceae bacterium]